MEARKEKKRNQNPNMLRIMPKKLVQSEVHSTGISQKFFHPNIMRLHMFLSVRCSQIL